MKKKLVEVLHFFPEFKQSEIVLMNLSGGTKQDVDMEGWTQVINACKDKYTLFVAAAGNEQCNLNEKERCKVQPAAFKKLKMCKGF